MLLPSRPLFLGTKPCKCGWRHHGCVTCPFPPPSLGPQARQKAEAVANQEDVPMKQKMREIEKLYSQVCA